MTIPSEEIRSLGNAWRFLLDLLDPKKTPRVPRSVRVRARGVVRHFPPPSRVGIVYERAREDPWPNKWGGSRDRTGNRDSG